MWKQNLSLSEQIRVDNLLHTSWCDNRWVPMLNTSNIMDYFTEKSNPFYSKECNNEFLKMQQNSRMDQLAHMQGTEYVLLHHQDPVLFIVRRQQRFSPTQVHPQSAYHIIAGQIYQTPDLGSVINSRLVSVMNNLNTAFSELQTLSQYHPSRGYSWQKPKSPLDAIGPANNAATSNSTSNSNNSTAGTNKKTKTNKKSEPVCSTFQVRRVDSLLSDLAVRFPYKPPSGLIPPTAAAISATPLAASTASAPQSASQPTSGSSELKQEQKANIKSDEVKAEIKPEVKSESGFFSSGSTGNSSAPMSSVRGSKPPPEKRVKLC